MNTNKIMKLTAFSATWNGKKIQRFIMCEYVDGKAILSVSQLDKILKEEFGSIAKGATFTIG